MSPGPACGGLVKEVAPLGVEDSVRLAVERLAAEEVPALAAVDREGLFVGTFGEREFLGALFPGYLSQLGSSAMISRSVDRVIGRRRECLEEGIRPWLTTDRVVVDDDFSETQVAELFLHHRVLIVPVGSEGRPHGVITRHEFFADLARRFGTDPARS